MTSKKTQNEILQKFNIKVIADPAFKRNMAERAILEVKLRLAIQLDLQSKGFFQTIKERETSRKNKINIIF